MEKMPFRVDRVMMSTSVAETTGTAWRRALPVLRGETITLRELRLSDAPALLAMLTSEEVARFISPPPATVDGFERFIRWTQAERQAGMADSGVDVAA